MIPAKATLEFFTKGNFAFDQESLTLKAGGPGAEFHRTPASFTGRLVQLFKEKTALEQGDPNFFNTTWAPLTLTACSSFYRTLLDAFCCESTPAGRLEQALTMIHSMGWGKVQIVESRPARSVLRLFHSYEDQLYVEKLGKAPCPVTAYTAGMLLAAHLFSLSFEPGQGEPEEIPFDELISVVDTFEQERCEAEGQPYGEFVINSKR